MTYENVVSWCEKNIPQEESDTFAEWYSVCEDAVNTPNLFESADFNKLMEDSWLNSFGTFDRGTKPIQVPTQTTLPLPKEQPKPEALVILPKTGSAPIIPKPVLVVPENIPEQKKKSLFARFKDFIRGKK